MSITGTVTKDKKRENTSVFPFCVTGDPIPSTGPGHVLQRRKAALFVGIDSHILGDLPEMMRQISIVTGNKIMHIPGSLGSGMEEKSHVGITVSQMPGGLNTPFQFSFRSFSGGVGLRPAVFNRNAQGRIRGR